MGTLVALNVHPLKSGAGIPLTEAVLTPRGLLHDREFMLVDAEGAFLSQRKHPRMALLRTAYDGEVLSVNEFVHKAVDDGGVREVTVHGRPCLGVEQGDEAAAYFSDFLGLECRLVRFTGHRATRRGEGELAFADGYPLLVVSQESLDDLNGHLDEPVPMNRFRPNLVFSGLGAFGEDGVGRLRVGETEIELIKPCGRCVITTVDQETGVKGRQPLAALARYRAREFEGQRQAMFGQNAIPRTTGNLKVGDPVEVLEYKA
ncbi:MOSC domain-containing protein [Actinocorallia populi]|uniref:MOSC domain-containing protein n=1 Tax=Actinocorallia populi TaxID=2079200 RepID=UPI000D09440F|nr:MOSC N-terminal beta barrel domain-containing protein [Actinocorallia populi]